MEKRKVEFPMKRKSKKRYLDRAKKRKQKCIAYKSRIEQRNPKWGRIATVRISTEKQNWKESVSLRKYSSSTPSYVDEKKAMDG